MYIFSAFAKNKNEYLQNLINKASYTYYLIGSSGNGKNFMMRKIGDYFSDKKITYFFCSFDSKSLDGVLIDDKVLIIDASYPHNLLPTIYKVNGEVVNLGALVSDNIQANKIYDIYCKEITAKNEYLLLGKTYSEMLDDLYAYYEKLNLTKQKENIVNFVNNIQILPINSIVSDCYYKQNNVKNKKIYSLCTEDEYIAKYLLCSVKDELQQQKIAFRTYHNIYNNKFVESIETGNIYIGNNCNLGTNIEIYGQNSLLMHDYSQIERQISKKKEEALAIHKRLELAYKPYIKFNECEPLINKLILKIKDKLK